MSYDLFFSGSRPTLDDFAAYFIDRGRYALDGSAAQYHNEDTGVYFLFEHGGEDESSAPVAFNLNYFRPHYFGLEAAIELQAFVHHFSLDISDPQTEGMGDGPFSVEGFLRGWNAGNRFAYSAILSSTSEHERPTPFVYSTAGLEQAWRWNYGRGELQDRAGDMLFVPRIMFMKSGQRACTAAVWPDACPIYLPPTDLVFLFRHELATGLQGDERDIAVVTWQEIAPWASAYPLHGDAAPYYELAYDEAPEELTDFVRTRPASPPLKEMGIGYDEILNEELVGEATS